MSTIRKVKDTSYEVTRDATALTCVRVYSREHMHVLLETSLEDC